MLGFGFNKAKVLASADRNVKQGKLQNAIADYERILQEDPNDLNVLNTIGDLYARLGDVEQATTYFQRVGDAYASDGFTVKAIAMYKKLTKQNPTAARIVQKLADLYAQQGLNNDARVQYTIVAEQHLRNGDPEAAATVFQKMLELDPDNPQMQNRLAEIYVRLGKKQEARDIFFRSAQALRSRGALDACDEALAQVLKLDPSYSQGILLRGQVRMEANDLSGTVECLEKLPDLDSRPEALRMLLKSRLKLGNLGEAEPLARKLLAVFNDISGISAYAESLMVAGDFEAALHWYDQHSVQLLSADAPAVIEILHKIIAPLKDKPRALEKLCELFQKAGNTTHLAEVTELLAHASVQEGALEKARDLYKRLGDMEPENPLHVQNYRQILARLESNVSTGEISPEENAQALAADELEEPAPPIEQRYTPAIDAALRDAFTDAELFESYNLPSRAIAPLETALPRAPRDLQLNRRLASLYARCGRMAEAAKCCQTIESVCADAGFHKEANQYRELAGRYAARAGVSLSAPPAGKVAELAVGIVETAPSAPPPPAPVKPATPPKAAQPAPPPKAAPAPVASPPASTATPGSAPYVQASSTAPAASVQEAVAHEIDLSDEWERVLTSDQSSAPIPEVPGPAIPAGDAPRALPMSHARDAAVGDIVEEAQFYISQSMLDEARGALSRAEAIAPQAAAIVELRAQLAALTSRALPDIPKIEIISSQETATPPGSDVQQTPSPSPAYFPEPAAPQEVQPPAPTAEERARVHELELAVTAEPALDSEPILTGTPGGILAPPKTPEHRSVSGLDAVSTPIAVSSAPPVAEPAPKLPISPVLAASSEDLLDSSELLGEVTPQAELLDLPEMLDSPEVLEFLDVSGISPASTPIRRAFDSVEVLELPEVGSPLETPEVLELEEIAPTSKPLPGGRASESADVLELIEPLVPPGPRPKPTPELGTLQFTPEPPPGKTDQQPPSATHIKAPAEAGQPAKRGKSGDILGDLVLDLEESLGQDFNLAALAQAPPPAPAAPEGRIVPPTPAPAAPIASVPAPLPKTAAPKSAAPATASAAPAGTLQPAPATLAVTPEPVSDGGALSDLFAEFKQELESATDQEDDPETHYNLGVAFKEMGLLDEAIGELQKVCKSVEQGQPFSQVMEAYTWLADCFVQNGMPEAGIHWYMKALRVPGLDEERTVAVHYELACAYEASGNLTSARSHFMHVLSINIDYRDVAERIKALKS